MAPDPSYPVGTILRREDPLDDGLDELRVAGNDPKTVVTSNVEFGDNYYLDEIVGNFLAEIPEGQELIFAEQLERERSPMHVFNGVGQPKVRQVESIDPRAVRESVKVDTGVPTQIVKKTKPKAKTPEVEPKPTASEVKASA